MEKFPLKGNRPIALNSFVGGSNNSNIGRASTSYQSVNKKVMCS